MIPIDSSTVQNNTAFTSHPSEIDTKNAKKAYLLATENPEEHHAAIGILLPGPEGSTLEVNLGKDENYGAHRVGSVTKTFTTFLALKLINKNVISLDTKCSDLIDRNILESVFQNPDFAAEMTLEQLLSHTAGLEQDDHNRQKPEPEISRITTMQERFIYEGTVDNGNKKYVHTHRPGDGIGSYSNAGLAVAAWMIEAAYAKWKESPAPIPFSKIMKEEIFKEVFELTDDTRIEPGPSNDVIGAAAGDMTSSVPDLLKVAKKMQQGEDGLTEHFGQNWQKVMLEPRDLFQHDGLGCKASAASIQHFGLNSEIIDGKFYDVTAVVIFPLKKEQPALVAMCDSHALGTAPAQQAFAYELQKLAGTPIEEEKKATTYDLNFFCPEGESVFVFKGDAYVVTDVDPFTYPDKIQVSRNGMKHELQRTPSFDRKDAIGYKDANGEKWMMVTKEKGKEGERKMMYSPYCLVSPSPGSHNLEQPPREMLNKVTGVYEDISDEVIYSFKERDGHLYFAEKENPTETEQYPALYLPKEDCWVVSLPNGRKDIKFRFPEDKTEPLTIVKISKTIQDSSEVIPEGDRLRPLECRKKDNDISKLNIHFQQNGQSYTASIYDAKFAEGDEVKKIEIGGRQFFYEENGEIPAKLNQILKSLGEAKSFASEEELAAHISHQSQIPLTSVTHDTYKVGTSILLRRTFGDSVALKEAKNALSLALIDLCKTGDKEAILAKMEQAEPPLNQLKAFFEIADQIEKEGNQEYARMIRDAVRPFDLNSVMSQVTTLFKKHYVDREKGEMIAEKVQLLIDSGQFEKLYDRQEFIDQMCLNLREIGQDAHLEIVDRKVLEQEKPQEARVSKVKVDVENGCFELSKFDVPTDLVDGKPLALLEVDQALNELRESNPKAIIIDLRENRGGNPYMMAHIASYFVQPDQMLGRYEYRDELLPEEKRSFPTDPIKTRSREELPLEKRMLTQPIYILTSEVTLSAAESLIYHLKEHRQAVVIGAQTGGGAHVSKLFEAGPDFYLGISFGDYVLESGEPNWEAKGIAPDIVVDPEEALKKAQELIK
ncbi:MAG: serine hydrolase [Verrucomicrobia bacterium]|nr:serine hydrolase [Verrucomicrobiota bacterium]